MSALEATKAPAFVTLNGAAATSASVGTVPLAIEAPAQIDILFAPESGVKPTLEPDAPALNEPAVKIVFSIVKPAIEPLFAVIEPVNDPEVAVTAPVIVAAVATKLPSLSTLKGAEAAVAVPTHSL